MSEHLLQIKGIVSVVQIRESKDKVSGQPTGDLFLKCKFDGGMVDFKVHKKDFPNLRYGEELEVLFDSMPTMVRMDFGENTTWRNGFVVGEVLSCKRVMLSK